MRRSPALPFVILVALAGCTAPLDEEASAGVDGKADGTSSALEGTRTGYGVLRLLNDGEGTSVDFLDYVVQLRSDAAENLIAHRDGPDGIFGTDDDDGFDDIAEVDDVPRVGPVALETLAEFAFLNDYLPGDDEVLGTFDGLELTYAEGERILSFANTATPDELSAASVPSRSATSILEARPIATVAILSDLYWVGPRTMEHLLDAVTSDEARALCENDDICEGAPGRCVGKVEGWGKCADLASYPGIQAPCSEDAECHPEHICIGQTVYSGGYCAEKWMRDSFTVGGESSIPSVAMSEPTAYPVVVRGQASVPEDILLDIDIEHSDPSSLWIGLQPPTGQEAVTLWDGATMSGPLPTHYVDHAIYRDDMVNGVYELLVQNVGGRGDGVLRSWTLTVTSRWD